MLLGNQFEVHKIKLNLNPQMKFGLWKWNRIRTSNFKYNKTIQLMHLSKENRE